MKPENYIFGFEKLDVWKQARLMNSNIYLTTSSFPNDERFGLISQIRRASVSVTSNIAEGSTRFHAKDQSRFYQIAFGSAVEVLNQLILSHDLGFIDDTKLAEIRSQISEITYKLSGLIKNLDYKNSIKE
jgi:four helix bundle protein